MEYEKIWQITIVENVENFLAGFNVLGETAVVHSRSQKFDQLSIREDIVKIVIPDFSRIFIIPLHYLDWNITEHAFRVNETVFVQILAEYIEHFSQKYPMAVHLTKDFLKENEISFSFSHWSAVKSHPEQTLILDLESLDCTVNADFLSSTNSNRIIWLVGSSYLSKLELTHLGHIASINNTLPLPLNETKKESLVKIMSLSPKCNFQNFLYCLERDLIRFSVEYPLLTNLSVPCLFSLFQLAPNLYHRFQMGFSVYFSHPLLLLHFLSLVSYHDKLHSNTNIPLIISKKNTKKLAHTSSTALKNPAPVFNEKNRKKRQTRTSVTHQPIVTLGFIIAPSTHLKNSAIISFDHPIFDESLSENCSSDTNIFDRQCRILTEVIEAAQQQGVASIFHPFTLSPSLLSRLTANLLFMRQSPRLLACLKQLASSFPRDHVFLSPGEEHEEEHEEEEDVNVLLDRILFCLHQPFTKCRVSFRVNSTPLQKLILQNIKPKETEKEISNRLLALSHINLHWAVLRSDVPYASIPASHPLLMQLKRRLWYPYPVANLQICSVDLASFSNEIHKFEEHHLPVWKKECAELHSPQFRLLVDEILSSEGKRKWTGFQSIQLNDQHVSVQDNFKISLKPREPVADVWGDDLIDRILIRRDFQTPCLLRVNDGESQNLSSLVPARQPPPFSNLPVHLQSHVLAIDANALTYDDNRLRFVQKKSVFHPEAMINEATCLRRPYFGMQFSSASSQQVDKDSATSNDENGVSKKSGCITTTFDVPSNGSSILTDAQNWFVGVHSANIHVRHSSYKLPDSSRARFALFMPSSTWQPQESPLLSFHHPLASHFASPVSCTNLLPSDARPGVRTVVGHSDASAVSLSSNTPLNVFIPWTTSHPMFVEANNPPQDAVQLIESSLPLAISVPQVSLSANSEKKIIRRAEPSKTSLIVPPHPKLRTTPVVLTFLKHVLSLLLDSEQDIQDKERIRDTKHAQNTERTLFLQESPPSATVSIAHPSLNALFQDVTDHFNGKLPPRTSVEFAAPSLRHLLSSFGQIFKLETPSPSSSELLVSVGNASLARQALSALLLLLPPNFPPTQAAVIAMWAGLPHLDFAATKHPPPPPPFNVTAAPFHPFSTAPPPSPPPPPPPPSAINPSALPFNPSFSPSFTSFNATSLQVNAAPFQPNNLIKTGNVYDLNSTGFHQLRDSSSPFIPSQQNFDFYQPFVPTSNLSDLHAAPFVFPAQQTFNHDNVNTNSAAESHNLHGT